jgi:hypothetical protein
LAQLDDLQLVHPRAVATGALVAPGGQGALMRTPRSGNQPACPWLWTLERPTVVALAQQHPLLPRAFPPCRATTCAGGDADPRRHHMLPQAQGRS